jgi:hypothetical protein
LGAGKFPGESWSVKTPDELGGDASKVKKLFSIWSFKDDAPQFGLLIQKW